VEAWPRLLPTVDSVERRNDRPGLEVGARFEVRQPRVRPAEYVVTELGPGHSFVWQARLPGVTTTASHRIDELPDGQFRITLRLDWSGPLALVARVGYSRMATSYMAQEAAAVLAVAGTASA
jgi:hypothetical protein